MSAPPAAARPALEVRGLLKSYGRRRALNGVDLAVPRGSLFGLVGSNGAGKTTLMMVSMGLLRADGGTVDVLGEGPFHPARHAGRVSILPQDARLPLHARVDELLTYYGRLQGVPADRLPGEVEQLLRWVNLLDRARSPVRTLSHGMMRRLTVAQAFLGEPELVFLDEPMSGLDPREVARIRELLVQRRGRQAIVISSHVLSELEAVCDTVAFIDQGRRVRQDALSALMRHHHRLTYRIRPAPLPLEALQQAAPAAAFSLQDGGATLSVQLGDGEEDLAAANGRLLRILLDAGIGIEEVRRGSDLESEFFAATGG